MSGREQLMGCAETELMINIAKFSFVSGVKIFVKSAVGFTAYLNTVYEQLPFKWSLENSK